MLRSAILRKLTLRWAMFAFLVGSLAPWISTALAAHGGEALVQVCSAQGTKWVASVGVADESGKPSPDHVHALVHCPFCSHHVDSAVLPTKVDVALRAAPLAGEVPRLFLSAARTQHAWAPAQPRAPPVAA